MTPPTENEIADLETLIGFFRDRNFPDTAAGNAAASLQGLASKLRAEMKPAPTATKFLATVEDPETAWNGNMRVCVCASASVRETLDSLKLGGLGLVDCGGGRFAATPAATFNEETETRLEEGGIPHDNELLIHVRGINELLGITVKPNLRLAQPRL